MAENIVAGLFGLTPQMYGEQQRRSALREGIDLAKLTPGEAGAAMTYAGARGLTGAIAGAMGIEDPQMKRMSQRNQLLQQLDLTDPNSLIATAKQATSLGDGEFAVALVEKAKSLATQSQAILKSQAETRKLGAETTKVQSEDLTKQSQVRQLINTQQFEHPYRAAILLGSSTPPRFSSLALQTDRGCKQFHHCVIW